MKKILFVLLSSAFLFTACERTHQPEETTDEIITDDPIIQDTNTSTTTSSTTTSTTSTTTTTTTTSTTISDVCEPLRKDIEVLFSNWFSGELNHTDFLLKLQDRLVHSKVCTCKEVPYFSDVKKVVYRLFDEKEDAIEKLANICKESGGDVRKVREFLKDFFEIDIFKDVSDKVIISVFCNYEVCQGIAGDKIDDPVDPFTSIKTKTSSKK